MMQIIDAAAAAERLRAAQFDELCELMQKYRNVIIR